MTADEEDDGDGDDSGRSGLIASMEMEMESRRIHCTHRCGETTTVAISMVNGGNKLLSVKLKIERGGRGK